jgi:hypothetical protein
VDNSRCQRPVSIETLETGRWFLPAVLVAVAAAIVTATTTMPTAIVTATIVAVAHVAVVVLAQRYCAGRVVDC